MLNLLPRRRFIQTDAVASAVLTFPYLSTSRAAGALSIAFWDHWVPVLNDTLTKPCAVRNGPRRIAMVARTLRSVALSTAVALAFAGTAVAQTPAKPEKPQYGGSLSIGLVYYTVSPLSFDAADWPWKHNQDTGLTYEQLFAADLSKAKRNGGKFPFT